MSQPRWSFRLSGAHLAGALFPMVSAHARAISGLDHTSRRECLEGHGPPSASAVARSADCSRSTRSVRSFTRPFSARGRAFRSGRRLGHGPPVCATPGWPLFRRGALLPSDADQHRFFLVLTPYVRVARAQWVGVWPTLSICLPTISSSLEPRSGFSLPRADSPPILLPLPIGAWHFTRIMSCTIMCGSVFLGFLIRAAELSVVMNGFSRTSRSAGHVDRVCLWAFAAIAAAVCTANSKG